MTKRAAVRHIGDDTTEERKDSRADKAGENQKHSQYRKGAFVSAYAIVPMLAYEKKFSMIR
jgi:hypothetical protein